MRIGVADYGMNVWDGGSYNYMDRCLSLREIGYDGIERLTVCSAEEAVAKAAELRRYGMDFGTVRAPQVELSIQWTAGLGKSYVWTEVIEKRDREAFYRQVNRMAEACARYGIAVALHNHMGTLVETQPQLEEFLERCPASRLVFDTAHLAAMGGDCVEIVEKYADRLQVIHVKDWLLTDPGAEGWGKRGRFCGLGHGNIGLDNLAVLRAAVRKGYDGWVFVEHDTHLRDPLEDLRDSRNYLRQGGF